MLENKWKREAYSRIWKQTESGVLIIAVLLTFLLNQNVVYAEEKAGEIEIQYHGRTEKTGDIPLEGAVFVLYFIGEKQEGGWELSGEFEKSEISLEDKTASGRRVQADRLYQYAKENEISGKEQKTDVDGNIVFTGIKEGVYLVSQKEKVTDKEYGSFLSAPFLVEIPGEKGSYQVTVRPKSEWEPPAGSEGETSGKPEAQEQAPNLGESGKPEKPGIQTGDVIRVSGIAAAFILAFAMIILSIRKKEREEKEDMEKSIEETKNKENMQKK